MKEIFKTPEFAIKECEDYYLIVPFKKEIKGVFKEADKGQTLFTELIIDKRGKE